MGLTDVDDGPVRRCYGRQEIRVLLLENVSQKAVDVFVGQGFDVEAHAKLSEKEIVDKIGRVATPARIWDSHLTCPRSTSSVFAPRRS